MDNSYNLERDATGKEEVIRGGIMTLREIVNVPGHVSPIVLPIPSVSISRRVR